MNLAIDIGNTRVKAGLFNRDQLTNLQIYKSLKDLALDEEFVKQAQQAIIGSVVDGLEEDILKLNSFIPTQIFTSNTRIPLINAYQSMSTLGSDRLSASIGAYNLYPNKNVLVIDVGTCIKYNFTNHKNEYLGGAISPGILMRLKALHQNTSKLPLVEVDFSYTDLIGSNTQNSILSGVLNGSLAEVEEIINQYKQQFPDLICVLTGGDSEYLAKRLKNSIFVHQNLVLKGLNNILNYNIDNQ